MSMINSFKKGINRILLISPHGKITVTAEGSRERKLAVPPLGLAYLAAGLLNKGYEVNILDVLGEGYDNEEYIDETTIIYGLSDECIRKKIEEFKPELVGVSCIISNRSREVAWICSLVRKYSPDSIVVVGGQHPSGMPEMILDKNIDFILRGECDNTFPSLVEAITRGDDPSGISGIVFVNESGRISKNSALDFPDVKLLPYPAWNLLELEKYWHAGMCDYEIGGCGSKRFMVLITSRGCPHNCYFCTSSFMSGRKYRVREIEDVLREISLYREKYGVERIYFWDDNFFINKSRIKTLLCSLKDNFKGMTFEVTSGSEVNQIDDEIIDLMSEAGFKKIFLAVESPNEDIQDILVDKKVNLARIPALVEKIHSVGMIAEGSFMVGFPGETKKQIDRTFERVKDFGFDRISISIVNPLPGTLLYDECNKKGLFFEDFDPSNIRWSQENIRLPDVPRGYVARKRREVWVEYMKNKINIESYEHEKTKN